MFRVTTIEGGDWIVWQGRPPSFEHMQRKWLPRGMYRLWHREVHSIEYPNGRILDGTHGGWRDDQSTWQNKSE